MQPKIFTAFCHILLQFIAISNGENSQIHDIQNIMKNKRTLIHCIFHRYSIVICRYFIANLQNSFYT
jgi:hypothetical protein